MNLILKREPVWLDCLPTTPDVSATLLLLGGDSQQQVTVPVPLLLAVSPVVRSILADHLSPAYSLCCLSLPTTGDVLRVFGDILATGEAAGVHEDKINEVKEVFKLLGVEALLVSCHLESIQVGQALGRVIKQESLCDENSGPLDFDNKAEQKENIDVDLGELRTFTQRHSSPQILNKKPSLNLNQKKEYVCVKCSKKFTSKNGLVNHIKSVHDKIKFPCNLCPLKFTLKSNLLKHVGTVHDKIEYQCKLCPQKFTRKDSLLLHVKSIHDKIRIPCNLCIKKFSQKSNLKYHMDSAHKKKTTPCSLCLKKFTSNSTLAKHIKAVHEKNLKLR